MSARGEAKAAGIASYFTGKPCCRGHIAKRTTANGCCVICALSDEAKRRKENPHHRAKRIAALKKWKQKNIAYVRAEGIRRARLWAKANPDRARENSRRSAQKYRLRHPERIKAIKHARRFTCGKFTSSDISEILRLQKGKCANCRKKSKKLEIDHIVPVKHGGSNFRNNLQLLCVTCNRRKSSKLPHEWALANDRLI